MIKSHPSVTTSPEPGRTGNLLSNKKNRHLAGTFLKVRWDYYVVVITSAAYY